MRTNQCPPFFPYFRHFNKKSKRSLNDGKRIPEIEAPGRNQGLCLKSLNQTIRFEDLECSGHWKSLESKRDVCFEKSTEKIDKSVFGFMSVGRERGPDFVSFDKRDSSGNLKESFGYSNLIIKKDKLKTYELNEIELVKRETIETCGFSQNPDKLPKISAQSFGLKRGKSFSIPAIETEILPNTKMPPDPENRCCNCTQRRCLTFYCLCLKRNQVCWQSCICAGCLNQSENDLLRQSIYQDILESRKTDKKVEDKNLLSVDLSVIHEQTNSDQYKFENSFLEEEKAFLSLWRFSPVEGEPELPVKNSDISFLELCPGSISTTDGFTAEVALASEIIPKKSQFVSKNGQFAKSSVKNINKFQDSNKVGARFLNFVPENIESRSIKNEVVEPKMSTQVKVREKYSSNFKRKLQIIRLMKEGNAMLK